MRFFLVLLIFLLPESWAVVQDHFFRSATEEAIYKAASKYQVDPRLLAAICYHESKFQAAAIHKNDGGSGSYGLCQVKLAPARALGFKGHWKTLLSPGVNAEVAASILKYHLDHKNPPQNQQELLSAYNAGRVLRTPKGGVRNLAYVQKVEKLLPAFNNFPLQGAL